MAKNLATELELKKPVQGRVVALTAVRKGGQTTLYRVTCSNGRHLAVVYKENGEMRESIAPCTCRVRHV